jgi:hypothetical protein
MSLSHRTSGPLQPLKLSFSKGYYIDYQISISLYLLYIPEEATEFEVLIDSPVLE